MNIIMMLTNLYGFIKKIFGFFIEIAKKIILSVYRERILLILFAILGVLVTEAPRIKLNECQKMEGKWYFIMYYSSISPDIECMHREYLALQLKYEFELSKVKLENKAKIENKKMEIAESVLKIATPGMIKTNGKEVFKHLMNYLINNTSSIERETK